jgi:hypothetical protein
VSIDTLDGATIIIPETESPKKILACGIKTVGQASLVERHESTPPLRSDWRDLCGLEAADYQAWPMSFN